jgi:hypothetical protein
MEMLSTFGSRETAQLASLFMSVGAELLSAVLKTLPEDREARVNLLLDEGFSVAVESRVNGKGETGLALTTISPGGQRTLLAALQPPNLTPTREQ